MKKSFANPFKFGDPVNGDYYLPRPGLQSAVRQFLENQIHVVLIGPRRFGKTSFVLNLLEELEKSSYKCFFIDIFNITSHRDFLQQMLRGLRSKRSKLQELLASIPKFRPKMSADFDLNTGHSSIELALEKSSDKDVKEMIQDVLARLEKLGEKVILVIDEFQKITELNDNGWLEGTLRIHMQQLRNTSFLFTGSRRGIIYDMLNNSKRPLYHFCQSIEFPSFGKEFTDWVVKRFSEIEVKCDLKAINHLRDLVRDTPNYVQMICFHMAVDGKSHVNIKAVEHTLKAVVQQNAYAYQTLLNSLTPMQQRTLRLAAKENKQIYAKDLREKYEISSGAALASAIKSLKLKGIIEEEAQEKGKVVFNDPLFAFWLKNFLI